MSAECVNKAVFTAVHVIDFKGDGAGWCFGLFSNLKPAAGEAISAGSKCADGVQAKWLRVWRVSELYCMNT